jgi:predicted membrane chloride channel (bestrophin family)
MNAPISDMTESRQRLAATVTVCWNAAVETQELSLPLLSLPLTPITIVSPSLGLLLVFRTSGAYARYTEAVQTYALTISYATDIVRNGKVPSLI